jgi:hypothetical protein
VTNRQDILMQDNYWFVEQPFFLRRLPLGPFVPMTVGV